MRLERVTCWTCEESLEIRFVVAVDGMPPDDPDHSLYYRHTVIGRCPRCGRGQVERFDHDCFHWDEPWDMAGWWCLAAEDEQLLERAMRRCPLPRDGTCRCELHASLASSLARVKIGPWFWFPVLDAIEECDRARRTPALERACVRYSGGVPTLDPVHVER
jgi:hypothetical protein